MERRKLRLYRHLVRIAEDRKPRQILEARIEGKRGGGRPRKVWMDDIKEAAGRSGKTIEEARSMAIEKPRKRWKEEVERDLHVLGVRRWRELVTDRKKRQDIVQLAKAHSGL
jgi:hypothetical protein